MPVKARAEFSVMSWLYFALNMSRTALAIGFFSAISDDHAAREIMYSAFLPADLRELRIHEAGTEGEEALRIEIELPGRS